MITNKEMYDFASQIAGITDADLQQYKCGGKTKKKSIGGDLYAKTSKSSGSLKADNSNKYPKKGDAIFLKPNKKINDISGQTRKAGKNPPVKNNEVNSYGGRKGIVGESTTSPKNKNRTYEI